MATIEVKDRVREYLSSHPKYHKTNAIARAINAPVIDVIEASLELAKEGHAEVKGGAA